MALCYRAPVYDTHLHLSKQNRLYLDISTSILHPYTMRPTKRRLARLYAINTDEQIGRIFGVTGRSVGGWRKHYGIPTKPRINRYSLNRDFFSTINTQEKAYVLGLIASDGWVSRSGKQVSLALQVRDRHIIYDVRRAMQSNARVFEKARGGFPGSGTRMQVIFDSKKLASDLAKYGVVPGKSKTLRYPAIPRRFERHFARGLFDGDGHIRAVPKRLFYFLGTKWLIEGLADAIVRHTGIRLKPRRAPGCWRLSGYGGSGAVLRWMYQDATIFLRRKNRVYLDYWQ
jgi:hypothetical protein